MTEIGPNSSQTVVSAQGRWAAISRVLIVLVVMVAACGGQGGPPSLAVGSDPDAKSSLIGHLYAAALRYYGSPAHVEAVPNPLAGLDSGAFGVVGGLTGRLLRTFEPDAAARADMQVYRAMVSALPEGVAAGDYTTAAEDKPAVAVTAATADAWGGRDVTAMVRNCAAVKPGALAGARTPAAVGLCRLSPPREFIDAPTLFAALRAGVINAAWTTTAAPDIPAELVVLADGTSLIRAENLVPLYRRNELTESQVLAVNELAGVLDTATLAQLRAQVADGADPRVVADEFLAANPLGR